MSIFRILLPYKAILVFLFAASILYGQQYTFKHFNIANGLGSASVNHIFQDSRGYIWFATQNGGVSRFDGKAFTSFKRSDGLVGNDVTYITETNDNHIWIATASGVSEFDGQHFKNYTAREGLGNGVVYCILQNTDNTIWFATQDDGVKIFNGQNFDSLTVAHGLPSNSVYTLQKGNTGSIWLGLSGGIASYSKGKVTSYSSHTLVKNKTFFSSLLDNAGNIWFGSVSGDVIKVRPDNRIELLQLPTTVKNDFIGGIAQDKKGNLWFATDHGLLKHSNDFQLFNTLHGLSVNSVQAVMCDYEGGVWCGTLSGGANLLRTEAFVRYSNGLNDANVTFITPGKLPGEFYVGTGNGMYLFYPKESLSFRKISLPEKLNQLSVSSISVSPDERIWVTAEDGVYALRRFKNSFQLEVSYTEVDGVQLVSPVKTVHDKKGTTYVATFGSGVLVINGNKVRLHSVSNGMASNNVLTAFTDSKDNVWFGTLDAGLLKFGRDSIGRSDENLPDEAIWAIDELPTGELLLGTGESGLVVVSNSKLKFNSKNNITRLKHIPAIAFDQAKRVLWLGGDKGVERIEYTATGQFGKSSFYGESEGFPGISINQNSLCISSDGKLFFSTTNGVWNYLLNEDKERLTPPKLELTDIRLFFQETDWSKYTEEKLSATGLPLKLELPHDQNHLTFKIQALTTGNVNYLFKLEGQDADWTIPSTVNEVTYSNISPGKSYILKAQAITSSGITSAQISFPFTVHPPWWDTWLFRIVGGIIVVGLLLGFIWVREKALRTQNKKLEHTVQQRTWEIERQKKSIESTLVIKEALLREKEILLKEIHHRVKNNLQTISSMLMLQSSALKDEEAKKAITESQSRVRSIALIHQKLYQTDGLEKVELGVFVQDLYTQVHSLYKPGISSLQFRLNIPETFILIDTAIPLGLILNELLTNSFKYAFKERNAGKIEIALSSQHIEGTNTGKKITLVYFDDGPGVSDTQTLANSNTLGLRLIRLLSQQISANIEYSNVAGSEFRLSFKTNV